MKIGILGIGVIGSAIVEGFSYQNDPEHELYISPRNEERSKALAEKYPCVTRCSSNQEVLDQSELVIISVLPQIGLKVLEGLSFNKTHHVVNLMSDKKLDQLRSVIGQTQTLVHMVPLSFISRREGPIAIYPPNSLIEDLFKKLGHIIVLDDLKKIEAIAAITGLMTSYYSLLNDIVSWGEDNGLSNEESKDYTTNFFLALSKHAKEDQLPILANEMTPGGINELGVNYIRDLGGFKQWIDILDPMLKRINRK